MSSGIISIDSQNGGGAGGKIMNMSKGSVALGLLVVGIIFLVIGLYLVSSENTSSGYPVLITGVLAGSLGGYLMYSVAGGKNKREKSRDSEKESEREGANEYM